MRLYLAAAFSLKRLETYAVYDRKGDELYELDEEAFRFLEKCSSPEGCGESSPRHRDFIDYCLAEGILSTHAVTVKRPLPVPAGSPSLRYLELQITERCTLRCRHCYLGETEGRELPTDEIEAVLHEFEEMQGLRLLITGGEPLLHHDFDAVNRLLPAYSFRKVLFTNGMLLHDGVLQTLNVDEIQFSIDGMEQGHDALRGAGSYRALLGRVESALQAGWDVSVATMVHRENLGEFEEMSFLFRRMGIKDWTVDVPSPSGRMAENPLLQVPPEKAGRFLAYGFGGGMHGGGEGFACGLHLAAVLANGAVAKCAFYAHAPSGSIREGLRNGWAGIRPLPLAELECSKKGCRFIELCRGGCRFRASAASGGEGEGQSGTGNEKVDRYRCCAYDTYDTMNQREHEAPG
ncbi:MAG: radical SAM protein [Thermodesulfovibrionales bacterium]